MSAPKYEVEMNWLLGADPNHSQILIFLVEAANLISGIILLLTPAVLCYFLKEKERGISDPVLYVVTSVLFLLGVRSLVTVWIEKWAAYPAYCTLVDVAVAMTLLVLSWSLPPLILRILAAVSREELLIDLLKETNSKIAAQDSATSLETSNAELQAVISKFDAILNLQHWPGDQSETVAQLWKVISSKGGPHGGG